MVFNVLFIKKRLGARRRDLVPGTEVKRLLTEGCKWRRIGFRVVNSCGERLANGI